MTNQIQKKYLIKIPSNICVFYCNEKKILTFSNSLIQKSLKLKVKLFFSLKNKTIFVSSSFYKDMSNIEKKKKKVIQGTTHSLIKQLLIETMSVIYKKLQFVGVGYRLVSVESFENQLILLRLGFSHLFYFRIPKKFKMFYKKRTRLFISGNSFQYVSQIVSDIRSLKSPEPYKGKGILYENEKIVLKEGKKV